MQTIEDLKRALKPGGEVVLARGGWMLYIHKTSFVKLVDQLCRQEPGRVEAFRVENPDNTGHWQAPRRRVVLL